MKMKLILCYLLILLSLNSYSQELSEKYIIGGSIGSTFSSSKSYNSLISSDSRNINLTSSIMAGYFVKENIGLGIALEYYLNNTNYKNSSIEYSNGSNSQISPFFRYYLKSNIFFHSQFNIGYSNSEAKVYINIDLQTIPMMMKTSYFSYGYGVGVGYNLKIHDRIYLEPLIRFISNRLNEKENDSYLINNSVYFNLGIAIRI